MDSHECPLCLEELDVTERNFHPCKCGYQVCLWCWHKINEKLKGKCPACRTDYDPQGFQFVAPDQESLQKERQKERDRDKAKFPTTTVTTALGLPLRKDDVRVLQRNLCYVMGIPHSLAKEEVLKTREHFGQFGRIVKIAVSKKMNLGGGASSCSAYITYKRTQDAERAIKAYDGLLLGEITKPMKATFGTTKYCSSFLRSQVCTKPNCLYLHETACPEDCYSREDLALVNAATQIASATEKIRVDASKAFPFDQPPTSAPTESPFLSANFDMMDANDFEDEPLDEDGKDRLEMDGEGARPTSSLSTLPGSSTNGSRDGQGSALNHDLSKQHPQPGPGHASQKLQQQLQHLQLRQLHQHLTQPRRGEDAYYSPDTGYGDEDGDEDDQDVLYAMRELGRIAKGQSQSGQSGQGGASPASPRNALQSGLVSSESGLILLGSIPRWDFRKFIRVAASPDPIESFSVIVEGQLPSEDSPVKSRFAFGDADYRSSQDAEEWRLALLEAPWPTGHWGTAAE